MSAVREAPYAGQLIRILGGFSERARVVELDSDGKIKVAICESGATWHRPKDWRPTREMQAL